MQINTNDEWAITEDLHRKWLAAAMRWSAGCTLSPGREDLKGPVQGVDRPAKGAGDPTEFGISWVGPFSFLCHRPLSTVSTPQLESRSFWSGRVGKGQRPPTYWSKPNLHLRYKILFSICLNPPPHPHWRPTAWGWEWSCVHCFRKIDHSTNDLHFVNLCYFVIFRFPPNRLFLCRCNILCLIQTNNRTIS